MSQYYRHFKGHLYEFLHEAFHSETQEDMVVYRSVDDGKVWVRPKNMFFEDVKKDGYEGERFKEQKCTFEFNGKEYSVKLNNIPTKKFEYQTIHDSGLPIYGPDGELMFSDREPQSFTIPTKTYWESIEMTFATLIEPFKADRAVLKIGDTEWILENVISVVTNCEKQETDNGLLVWCRALVSYTNCYMNVNLE